MKIAVHIGIWLFLFFIETLLYWAMRYENAPLEANAGFIAMLMVPRAILSYLFVYWFLPKEIMGKKKAAFLLLKIIIFLFASLLVYRLFLNYLAFPIAFGYFPGFDPFAPILSSYSFIRVITPMALIYTTESIMANFQKQRKLELLEKEKLQSELQFLKAQVNPHFLFNTLNNIYVLATKKSDTTAPAVSKLSKLLRFVLYESSNHKIPLKKELEIVNDYLELEKLRYSNRLELKVEKNIENLSYPIAPLILLPFIENAFKHGAGESTSTVDVRILLNESEGQFLFCCKNSYDSELNLKNGCNGVGLANVKRRLDLIYPDRYSLEFNQNETKYCVQLKLDLNE